MNVRITSVLMGCAILLILSGGESWGKKAMELEAVYNPKSFGAKADGKTDCTAAMQKAVDEAAKTGGKVYIPPGKWLITGSVRVAQGVTVQGASESPQYIEPLIGTVVLATGGRDKEDAPALFELASGSAVRGLTVFYPDQKPDDIHPYPWTIKMTGGDNTVENVTLINSYNGIRTGPGNNVRHRIRSVYGCVLRRGIFIDECTDIGRVENIQFHCHWWSAKSVGGDWQPIFNYMVENLEAFVFGRTDWEYVSNTFVFPVNIGYRFIATKAGACNGQFVGIGSDASQICVQVDAIQPMGLLITNGQFVSFTGKQPRQFVINNTCEGSVRLVNCAFWGPSLQNVVSHSKSFVSLSDCYLGTWHENNGGLPLIEADSGRLQVRGCSVATAHTAIALKKGLTHAIIAENNGVAGVKVENQIGDDAVIINNENAR